MAGDLIVWAFLIAATSLEATGDALVRIGSIHREEPLALASWLGRGAVIRVRPDARPCYYLSSASWASHRHPVSGLADCQLLHVSDRSRPSHYGWRRFDRDRRPYGDLLGNGRRSFVEGKASPFSLYASWDSVSAWPYGALAALPASSLERPRGGALSLGG